jgi:quinol monooxygenase YgiN
MIGVYAHFVCVDGKAEEFEATLGAFVSTVKAEEAGTITYQLFADRKQANHYFMLEIYADKPALTAHGATSHMAELAGKLGPLLAAPPTIISGPAVH